MHKWCGWRWRPKFDFLWMGTCSVVHLKMLAPQLQIWSHCGSRITQLNSPPFGHRHISILDRRATSLFIRHCIVCCSWMRFHLFVCLIVSCPFVLKAIIRWSYHLEWLFYISWSCLRQENSHLLKVYRQLRARRALSILKDVPLRTRRALSILKDVLLRTRRVLLLYKVYGNSTLLVLNWNIFEEW